MSEDYEWHDMVRKNCASFDEALALLASPGAPLLFDGYKGILQRKLDEGFELTAPTKVHHLSIYEYLGDSKFMGPWIIEYQVVARIKKL